MTHWYSKSKNPYLTNNFLNLVPREDQQKLTMLLKEQSVSWTNTLVSQSRKKIHISMRKVGRHFLYKVGKWCRLTRVKWNSNKDGMMLSLFNRNTLKLIKSCLSNIETVKVMLFSPRIKIFWNAQMIHTELMTLVDFTT